MERLMNAIKALDEMLEYLDKKEYACKSDGIGLTIFPDGECSISPIGWHSKEFDTAEEFIEYMEKKRWKKDYK